MAESVWLELTADEAIVMFELLSRYGESDTFTVVDQSEQRVMWRLLCCLEKALVEPLLPDYRQRLAVARERLKDSRDAHPVTATKPQGYAIRGAQALSIAQADAERVYGDLSPFQIEVRLEPDGWHVEYQLSQPTAKGGGPSYVIDPATGDILKKKYEQ